MDFFFALVLVLGKSSLGEIASASPEAIGTGAPGEEGISIPGVLFRVPPMVNLELVLLEPRLEADEDVLKLSLRLRVAVAPEGSAGTAGRLGRSGRSGSEGKAASPVAGTDAIGRGGAGREGEGPVTVNFA